jgi:hypothetical protein
MTYFKTLVLIALSVVALSALLISGSASATTLEVGGVPQSKAVEMTATLEAQSSLLMKDSAGTTTDTCTEAAIVGLSISPFSGAKVGTPVSILTLAKCSHTVKTLSKGSLSIEWLSGTTNGTVSSAGAEITIFSTAFGVSAVCKTGAGTDLGTLTGATTASNASAHATLDLNAKISCGILGTATWTASFSYTSPTDLGVVS